MGEPEGLRLRGAALHWGELAAPGPGFLKRAPPPARRFGAGAQNPGGGAPTAPPAGRRTQPSDNQAAVAASGGGYGDAYTQRAARISDNNPAAQPAAATS